MVFRVKSVFHQHIVLRLLEIDECHVAMGHLRLIWYCLCYLELCMYIYVYLYYVVYVMFLCITTCLYIMDRYVYIYMFIFTLYTFHQCYFTVGGTFLVMLKSILIF